jgi:hypothetical protein
MKTRLGEERRRSRRYRAGGEFSHHVRKQEQATDDAKNIQTIRQIEIFGPNSKIVFCDLHVRCP